MSRSLTLALTTALTCVALAESASATIQDQIDACVTPCNTVTIAPGAHAERVAITKDLRLRGPGAVLRAPDGNAVIDVSGPVSVVIEEIGVEAAGSPGDGIVVRDGARATLSAITVTGFASGVGVLSGTAAAARIDLLASTITANGLGVQLGAALGTVRSNRIAGNTTGLDATTAVDASRNWWGCNGGPGTSGCDSVTGPSVVTAAHLVLRLSSQFAQIQTGGATTQLVADVTRDSAGQFAGAAFPESTVVTFAAGLGALSPVTAAMTSASAATTLTSGAVAGDAAPTATLDAATVSTAVAFAAPPTTTTSTTATTSNTTPPAATTVSGAKLLADARKAIGSRVVRLLKSLKPGVAYVAPAIRKGHGTLAIPDQDVVSLLVLACPEQACSAGVSAQVARTTSDGRKAKPFSLRRAKFELAAGRMRVVAVLLTKSRRAAIRAARRAVMTVTIAVSDKTGSRSKATLRVQLKIKSR